MFIATATLSFAKDYIIYSVAQEFPMTSDHVDLRKNYYINMGKEQGLKEGAKIDVYRTVSVLDPYGTKSRYDHKVKIGELAVLHLESNSAICQEAKLRNKDKDAPYFEIDSFMIGDKVDVHVKN